MGREQWDRRGALPRTPPPPPLQSPHTVSSIPTSSLHPLASSLLPPKNLILPRTRRTTLGENSLPMWSQSWDFPFKSCQSREAGQAGLEVGTEGRKRERERSRKSFFRGKCRALVCWPDVRCRFHKPPRGLRKALRCSDGPAQSWPSSLERHLHLLG